ncbi:NAD(P)-dependent oxidoreductase [Palleronia abyssalis]|uniref:NAD(P)-binding domain-containing protein n=1 Tax=Palleronia abyssalis TaxID=1501240 RepID=A0A2R8BTY9_9RHOB|nr:NAD(P)H-binding protein [Palleronia abyssalis]SPJ23634.1 hypothetical protein PAA8504_01447 [Palleronia abyssalis]
MRKTLAIFGANGATGRHAVKQAVARGHSVRAIEKAWPEGADLPEGVEARTADVTSDDLAPHIEGCDAVISCIGVPLDAGTALSPPPLYTDGTRSYIDAMGRTGVRRIVVISATFVETLDRGPLLFRAAAAVALQPIFTQMGEMERLLRASDTDWTAVRPGWLMTGDKTCDYTVTPDVIAEGLIRTRHGDLAHFMLDCAEGDDWIRRTPAIARREASEYESGHALAAEMAP